METVEDDWDDVEDEAEDGQDDEDDVLACPSCGADIYADSPRCPRCGEYVSAAEAWSSGRPAWVIVTACLCLAMAVWWVVSRVVVR